MRGFRLITIELRLQLDPVVIQLSHDTNFDSFLIVSFENHDLFSYSPEKSKKMAKK